MGNLIQNTIFGRAKYTANTFIGGVAASLNTPALIAAKLGIASNRIKAFKIIDNDIEFAIIGGSYTIGPSAFANNSSLTYYNDSLGLVTGINSGTFFNCKNVTSYNFPEVTTITAGSGTFAQNNSLVSISFPKLTTIIDGFCFYNNPALTSFNAPLLSGTIPQNTFELCINMTSCAIGIITKLGINAFNGCSKLSSFDCSYLTSIPDNAFQGCTLLSNVGSLNGIVTIGKRAFSACSNIAGAITANSVTTIDIEAFRSCIKVTSYSFPLLTSIIDSTGFTSVFSGNVLLTSFSAPLLTSIINNYTFFGSNAITTFYAPNLILTSSNAGTFYGLINLITLTIGKPTGLGETAFYNCQKLTTIDLSNCTSFGDGSLNGCLLISSIYAPLLLTCGSTTANNNVLAVIKFGITITVPVALQTINAGAPDGDLVYAANTRGANIVYV